MIAPRQNYSAVGKGAARQDALDKVLGKPIFTADMIPRESLYVAFVRSTRPHARILHINTKSALSIKGVRRFIGSDAIPGVNNVGIAVHDKPLFCKDTVRCVGDPIGAILAENKTAAWEAASQVEVEYADLPAVFSPLDALKPDSVKVHENGNVTKHLRIRKGDVERGFLEAAVIVEDDYKTSMQECNPIEPESAFALPPDEDGILTVVGPWQCIFDVQDAVAMILGLPATKVRVLQAQTGGAFGCRSNEIICELSGLTALAACLTGKPTAILMSREESIVAHSKRHPFYMKYKTGAKRDGRLVAEEIQLVTDTGAYASFGANVLMRAIVHCTGPYVIPNVKADAYCVYTNNPYAGSFRGFGCPQVHFAAESQINRLAEALSMDPIEIRRKNLLRPGTATNTAHVLGSSVGLEECLTRVVDRLKSIRLPAVEHGNARGIGVSVGYHGNSLGPEGGDRCGAMISIMADGTVEYMTGLTEYGTGARFGHAQMIAETLGIGLDKIHCLMPNSLIAPFSGPTAASRSTVMGGNAALMVSKKLRERLSKEAARVLDCRPEDVFFADEMAQCKIGSRRIPFAELASICHKNGVSLSQSDIFQALSPHWDEESGLGVAYHDYTFGAIAAVVDLNLQTGYPKVVQIVSAFDCGTVINPLSVIGQAEGGIVQGLGYAVMEEICTTNGRILNPNLADYFICTSVDAPPIETILVEGYPSATGPFGAKAIAEPPIDFVAPAITQAIYNATGVRINEIPAVAEKILLGHK
jgi:CO/xanthine dehydrogenase Mo-binding subunit